MLGEVLKSATVSRPYNGDTRTDTRGHNKKLLVMCCNVQYREGKHKPPSIIMPLIKPCNPYLRRNHKKKRIYYYNALLYIWKHILYIIICIIIYMYYYIYYSRRRFVYQEAMVCIDSNPISYIFTPCQYHPITLPVLYIPYSIQ